jgi:hypothetical protein
MTQTPAAAWPHDPTHTTGNAVINQPMSKSPPSADLQLIIPDAAAPAGGMRLLPRPGCCCYRWLAAGSIGMDPANVCKHLDTRFPSSSPGALLCGRGDVANSCGVIQPVLRAAVWWRQRRRRRRQSVRTLPCIIPCMLLPLRLLQLLQLLLLLPRRLHQQWLHRRGRWCCRDSRGHATANRQGADWHKAALGSGDNCWGDHNAAAEQRWGNCA